MGVKGLDKQKSKHSLPSAKIDQEYLEICQPESLNWPQVYLQQHAERLQRLYAAFKTKLQRRKTSRKPSSSAAGAAIEISEQVKSIARGLGSTRQAQHFTLGTLVFGILVFLSGAAPGAIPWTFVAFFALCIPWRIVNFSQRKYGFYLIDFCYFANTATLIYFLFYPNNANVGAMMYALCDGPLAGALVVWQCAWVLGSADHTVSVMIHLLPGLSIFTHRHYPSIHGWQAAASYTHQHLLTLMTSSSSSTSAAALQPSLLPPTALQPSSTFLYLLAAPMAFYLTWQALYYIAVQLCCRQYILATGQETSYIGLAKRAQKTNNFWNRLVRRGSATRRCFMYGMIQCVFTLVTLGLFCVVYHSFALQLTWQVVKFVVPLYYGSKYQCQKMPQHAFLEGIKLLQQQQEAVVAAPVDAAAVPAAGGVCNRPKRSRSTRRGVRNP